MSDKHTFSAGDLVWILPYEDIKGGVFEHVSITRSAWEEEMAHNPHCVKCVTDTGNVRLQGNGFYWPPLGLTKVDPGITSVSLEDLI